MKHCECRGAVIRPITNNPLEADFQRTVIHAAKTHGWLVQHTRPAYRASGKVSTPISGHAGFPDLVLAHPTHGVAFIELKRDSGRTSVLQLRWIDTLKAAGARVWVARPKDWPTLWHLLATGSPSCGA